MPKFIQAFFQLLLNVWFSAVVYDMMKKWNALRAVVKNKPI